MQTAAKRQLFEAELRRAEFKVYEGTQGAKSKAPANNLKKRHRLRFRHRAQVLFAVFGLFLMSMSYVFLTTQATMVGYEINRQIALNEELNNDNARIMLEIETATSPEKVNEYAEEHLNMIVATEDSIVYYDTNATAALQVADTGMAVETSAMGYGSVEVMEQAKQNRLVEMFGSFFGALGSGRDGAPNEVQNDVQNDVPGEVQSDIQTDVSGDIQGNVQIGMQN